MVIARLSLEDAKEKGWLLDGYPRTFAQAESLEKLNVRPDICIILEVCHYVITMLVFIFPHCLKILAEKTWSLYSDLNQRK